jgi:hypothetical protein
VVSQFLLDLLEKLAASFHATVSRVNDGFQQVTRCGVLFLKHGNCVLGHLTFLSSSYGQRLHGACHRDASFRNAASRSRSYQSRLACAFSPQRKL